MHLHILRCFNLSAVLMRLDGALLIVQGHRIACADRRSTEKCYEGKGLWLIDIHKSATTTTTTTPSATMKSDPATCKGDHFATKSNVRIIERSFLDLIERTRAKKIKVRQGKSSAMGYVIQSRTSMIL